MSDYVYYRRSSVLLNWDVILHLAEYLSRSTLISLMSTCKDLRRYGVRYLLGEDRPITFWTLSDVRSLTAFMNSNIPEGTGGRSAHVRMVDLASKIQQWTHDENSLNNLVNLLKQSTNLYALSLHHSFFRFPSIAQSMCELPSPFRSLRRIRLEAPARLNVSGNATTAAAALMAAGGQNPATSPYFLDRLVGIPLEVIIISSFHSRANRAEIMYLLARFKDSLQELHIEDTPLQQGLAQGTLGNNIVFPKVRVLSMTHSYYALPRHTDTLIAVFPNVQSVAFPGSSLGRRGASAFFVHPNAPFGWQAIEFEGENAMPPPAHTFASLREANSGGQRFARWSSLAYYEGALEHLYILALRSQVDRLKITDLPLLATRVEWMHSVVQELAPTKLCLEVSVPDTADVELLNLMPRDLPRPLRYLEIVLLQWPEGEKLQSQLRLLCLATGTVRTLVIKVGEKVAMQYRNPRGIEEAHEQSEDFVIQTAQTARSLRHVGLPNDLFGPLPNEPQEEGKTWLPPKPAPKETFFWSIEHDDDGGMIYADKLSKRAAKPLLEFETSPVISSPFG
ncbi:unnamed protein product [Peniophora sp. CBMAI 1063]|nr:unnamed protein product [Peniophora sp. CBMAI 1063]